MTPQWFELTAFAAVVGVFVWLITIYLPKRDEANRAASERMDAENRQALKELSQEYRAELREIRQESQERTRSMCEALNNLADEFRKWRPWDGTERRKRDCVPSVQPVAQKRGVQ